MSSLLNNDANELKYWVVTPHGKRGPFDSCAVAAAYVARIPIVEGETPPRIVQLTESGQQVLLG